MTYFYGVNQYQGNPATSEEEEARKLVQKLREERARAEGEEATAPYTEASARELVASLRNNRQAATGLYQEPEVQVENDFGTGISHGWESTKATGAGLVGLVGDTFGMDSVRDWGFENYQEIMAGIQKESRDQYNWEGVKSAGDFADFVQYWGGYALPQLALAAVSGGVGGAIAKKGASAAIKEAADKIVKDKLKDVADDRIKDEVKDALIKQAVQQAGAKYATRGAIAGNIPQAMGMELGATYGEAASKAMEEEGNIDNIDLSRVALYGGLAGGLEFAADVATLGAARLMPNVNFTGKAMDLLDSGGLVSRVAKKGTVSGTGEGLTEMTQTGLEEMGAGATFEEANFSDPTSFGAGAVGGGMVGSVGGLRKPSQKESFDSFSDRMIAEAKIKAEELARAQEVQAEEAQMAQAQEQEAAAVLQEQSARRRQYGREFMSEDEFNVQREAQRNREINTAGTELNTAYQQWQDENRSYDDSEKTRKKFLKEYDKANETDIKDDYVAALDDFATVQELNKTRSPEEQEWYQGASAQMVADYEAVVNTGTPEEVAAMDQYAAETLGQAEWNVAKLAASAAKVEGLKPKTKAETPKKTTAKKTTAKKAEAPTQEAAPAEPQPTEGLTTTKRRNAFDGKSVEQLTAEQEVVQAEQTAANQATAQASQEAALAEIEAEKAAAREEQKAEGGPKVTTRRRRKVTVKKEAAPAATETPTPVEEKPAGPPMSAQEKKHRDTAAHYLGENWEEENAGMSQAIGERKYGSFMKQLNDELREQGKIPADASVGLYEENVEATQKRAKREAAAAKRGARRTARKQQKADEALNMELREKPAIPSEIELSDIQNKRDDLNVIRMFMGWNEQNEPDADIQPASVREIEAKTGLKRSTINDIVTGWGYTNDVREETRGAALADTAASVEAEMDSRSEELFGITDKTLAENDDGVRLSDETAFGAGEDAKDGNLGMGVSGQAGGSSAGTGEGKGWKTLLEEGVAFDSPQWNTDKLTEAYLAGAEGKNARAAEKVGDIVKEISRRADKAAGKGTKTNVGKVNAKAEWESHPLVEETKVKWTDTSTQDEPANGLSEKQRNRFKELLKRLNEGQIEQDQFDAEVEQLVIRVNNTTDTGVRFSKGTTNGIGRVHPTKRATREGLHGVMKQVLGQYAHNRIHIFDTEDEAIAKRLLSSTQAHGTQGWVSRNPRNGEMEVYFILENIPRGSELSVFLHEVGAHLGMENILTSEMFKNLVDKIVEWTNSDAKTPEVVIAKRAFERAMAGLESDRTDNRFDSELVAYFVEEGVDAGLMPTGLAATRNAGGSSMETVRGILRTVIGRFKAALRRLGVTNIDRLTGQDIIDLAYGAAAIEMSGTWHGTHTRFRKFDHAYISSGEGTQAFGWGTYVAEMRGIAEWYRDQGVGYQQQMRDAKVSSMFVSEVPELRGMPTRVVLKVSEDNATDDHPIGSYRDVYLSDASVIDEDGDILIFPVDRFGRVNDTKENVLRAPMRDLYVGLPKMQRFRYARKGLEQPRVPYLKMAGVDERYIRNLYKVVTAEKEAMYPPISDDAGMVARTFFAATENELIHWDAALEEQPEQVLEALLPYLTAMHNDGLLDAEGERVDVFDIEGGDLYKALVQRKMHEAIGVVDPDSPWSIPSDEYFLVRPGVSEFAMAVSKDLHALGVKGVSLIDGLTRGRDRGRDVDNYGRKKQLFDAVGELWAHAIDEDNRDTDIKVMLDYVSSIGYNEFLRTQYDAVKKFPKALAELDKWAAWDGTPTNRNYVVFDDKDIVRIAHNEGEDTNRDNLKFSKARDYVEHRMGATGAKAYTDASHLLKKGKDSLKFLHQFIRDAKNAIPSATKWYETVLKADMERNRLRQKVEEIAVKARELSPTRRELVNDFISQSTFYQLWGYDPELTDADGEAVTVKVDKDMAEQFDNLTEAEQDLVRAVFAHGEEMKKLKYELARELDIDTKFFGLGGIKGPYAPLKRFGNFAAVLKSQRLLDAEAKVKAENTKPNRDAVEALKSNSDHFVVSYFDTPGAAREFVTANEGRYAYTDSFERNEKLDESRAPDYKTFAKVLGAVKANIAGVPTEARQAFEKMVKDMYFQALDESNARLSGVKRMNRAGYDKNMIRSFLEHSRAESSLIANMMYGGEMNAAFSAAAQETKNAEGKREYQDTFNMIVSHYKEMLTDKETPIQDRVTAMTTVYMLTSSVAYHLTNATQVAMATVPKLAGDFGDYGKAWSSVLKGYKIAFKVAQFSPKNMATDINVNRAPEEYQSLLGRLEQMKLLDVGMEEDLSGFSQFNTGYEVIDDLTGTMSSITHKLYQVARYVEAINRISSAVGAFDMAKGDPARTRALGMAHPAEYAGEIVQDTQGNFSRMDAPLVLKKLPKVTGQYRKYQMMMGWLYANAFKQAFQGETPEVRAVGKRVLGYKLFHASMAAGVMGVPLMNLAAFAFAFMGDGDEPEDLERWLRKQLGDGDVAELLLKGPFAALGLDMSAKVGEDKIFSVLPFTDFDLNKDSLYKGVYEAFTGPAGAVASRFMDGAEYLAKGETYKGVEKMMPKGIASAMEAWRYSQEGFTLRNGDMIVDPGEFSPWLLASALGLPVSEIRKIRWTRGQQYEIEQFYKEKQAQLQREYRTAFKQKDRAKMDELKAKWQALQKGKDNVRYFFNGAPNALRRQPVSNLVRYPMTTAKRERKYQQAAGE